MPTVRLQSSDGEIFDTEEKVAKCSGTIKTLLEDCGMDGVVEAVIPLPNVNSSILRKVLEYADHHKNDPVIPGGGEDFEKRTDDMSMWDLDFLDVDQGTLFALILAANYLDVKGLMEAGCKTVANMIKGKTAEEIQKHFSTKNNLNAAKEKEE